MHIVKAFLVTSVIFACFDLKSNTYNSIGQVGLINLPSAETKSEQSIFFTYKKNDFTKLGTLTVTPFDWLEASYFYYRPHDIAWGGKVGSDLDKGFNVKFSYRPRSQFLPTIAIGLDDFAGTGRFTKEYDVTTYNFNHFKLTAGIGWGKFVGDVHKIKNPLSIFSDSFSSRNEISKFADKGGNITLDKFFRGDAVLFGGVEIPLDRKDKFSIKFETNPFDHFQFGSGVFSYKSNRLRKTDSNYNVGLSYKFNEYGNLDISFIKGNTVNFNFSLGFSSKKPLRKKEKFKPLVTNTDYKTDKKTSSIMIF